MRLEIQVHLDVTEVGIVARAGSCEIIASKEMAVAGNESEEFYRLISD